MRHLILTLCCANVLLCVWMLCFLYLRHDLVSDPWLVALVGNIGWFFSRRDAIKARREQLTREVFS